jgi:hypothetical protein
MTAWSVKNISNNIKHALSSDHRFSRIRDAHPGQNFVTGNSHKLILQTVDGGKFLVTIEPIQEWSRV